MRSPSVGSVLEALAQSTIASRNASRRWRSIIIACVLLLGSFDGVAAEEFKIGGTGTALRTMQHLADVFTAANPDVRITILRSLGSTGGIRAVSDGAIGLAVASRPLNEGERKRGLVTREYARTPFVFAVSTTSKITEITSAEMADIYAGKLTAWPDGSPIRIVLRPAIDIDTAIVKSISPAIGRGVAEAMERPGMRISPTDQDAADAIEAISGAIGPTTIALIVSEHRALRALKFDGGEPTLANAAGGTYPYYKSLFFVTGAKHSATVDRFVAFGQSPAGRKILEGDGHWVP